MREHQISQSKLKEVPIRLVLIKIPEGGERVEGRGEAKRGRRHSLNKRQSRLLSS